jgi:hypothetical protein
MRSNLIIGLIILLVTVMLMASSVMAAKLLCVSNQTLKGQETVGSCLAKGGEFAIVDDYGIVHILTPREIELTKLFNPKVLETRAYGLNYRELAPEVNMLKRRAVIGGPGR